MLNMLIELFEIARTFFFLGIIPGIIVFIGILEYAKEEEYGKIESFFISLLGALIAYVLTCIAIYIIVAILTALAGVSIIIAIVIVLLIILAL